MPSAARTPPCRSIWRRRPSGGPDGVTLHFDIDEGRKHNLLNGLDEIGLTLARAASIDAYEQKLAQREWA